MKARFPLVLAMLCAFTVRADLTVADFESGDGSIVARGADVIISDDSPAQGQSYARIAPRGDSAGSAYIRLPLRGQQLFAHAGLSAQLRASGAEGELKLMWLALDSRGRPIFQRRFALPPGEKWVTIDEPLVAWRWDNRFVGDADEVRELAMRIDSPVRQLDLDDVRLVGQCPPNARTNWVLQLAFQDQAHRVVEKDGLLVASDAPAMAEADLERLRQDMDRTRAFVRRAFGDAVHATDDSGPAMLLVFADTDGQKAFLERLGRAWRVQIAPPSGQGYTVQDIATASYRAELGPRRPVYLHESVHAIVARDLRLQAGHAPHSPLQEGLANFVQVCRYPQSIDRAVYPRAFAKGVGERTVFKPLEQLFSDRAEAREYAQLASVVAFLLDREPGLLRALAVGLAAGETASEAVAGYRTNWTQLQDRWLDWGRQRFGTDFPAEGGVFEVPPELH